ncbi:hypothetical protein OGAPHI_004461 [Ogataea philodendri]|uniref:Uncharacterized protein n=1 Tax=Ogataea philodendri TaxID=1378263 RepID=A0A9P8P6N1_9ASCO|nr:uncharacterized protein OGAPHI_004461 [Ogataea philodendri]KAH3666272.1 hypothetical protein OGAPHI_004461 [Ogataea philodendri]
MVKGPPLRQDTTSTSCHSVDVQLWRLDRDTCSGGLEHVIKLTVSKSRNVGRSTTHVESNQWNLVFWVVAGLGITNNTSSWTRENGTKTRKCRGINQTSIRLHELALHSGVLTMSRTEKTIFQARLETSEVLLDLRCQVSICHRGVCPWEQLDHWDQLVRQRDMRESDLFGNLTN